MEFSLLIYEAPGDFESREDERRVPMYAAWQAYHRALTTAGVYVCGVPLEPDATGTTVRTRGGQRHVQDGPYADTKEQLGGVITIDVPSLDEALEWAARCPTAASGAVEVRPVAPAVRRMVEGGDG